jgi:cAMP-dependent protein kinase regulator
LLFRNLSDDNKLMIVNAMEEVKFKKGSHVIKQGDPGGEFFIVDEGELDCVKTQKNGTAVTYLKTYF